MRLRRIQATPAAVAAGHASSKKCIASRIKWLESHIASGCRFTVVTNAARRSLDRSLWRARGLWVDLPLANDRTQLRCRAETGETNQLRGS